jgi:acyl-CoA thioesterase I
MKSESNLIQLNIIGDSLSERSNSFALKEKLGSGFHINDYSISGRNTLDWISDISRAFQIAPNLIILELGTNDAYFNEAYNFFEKYNILIQSIEQRSNAKIYLTLVPETNQASIQSIIKKNNSSIKTLSNKYTVIDLETPFRNFGLNNLYPIQDPIHPNSIGYNLIGEEYKKSILQNPR